MFVYFNLPTVLVLCAIAFGIGVYCGARWFGRRKSQ